MITPYSSHLSYHTSTALSTLHTLSTNTNLVTISFRKTVHALLLKIPLKHEKPPEIKVFCVRGQCIFPFARSATSLNRSALWRATGRKPTSLMRSITSFAACRNIVLCPHKCGMMYSRRQKNHAVRRVCYPQVTVGWNHGKAVNGIITK